MTEIQPYNQAQQGSTLMQKGVEKLRQHAELKAMAFDYAEFITKTGACPAIFKGKPADAAAAIIRGTALGFDPDGALEAFFVIQGKTGMYARAMIAVAENVGCRVWEVEASDESVTWAGTRPGDNKVETVTWDTKRVQLAGYDKNTKYKTNPLEMRRAKCQTELARILAPGALMGLVSEAEPDAHPTVQATAVRQDRPRERGADAVRAALAKKQEPVRDWVSEVKATTTGLELNELMNEAQNHFQEGAEWDELCTIANDHFNEVQGGAA
ncbi:hypothetical protein [Corynebacterium callunae]|uniref:hypothetical protein n=1 Tax=Corynebacterium callunae TaxID=1721 RepID=UPI001FFF1118|nr:hypothetical protein [Corynebacterium callunae]MCK2200506.1 hypothetical protein [Corynebacterium callunae]